MTPQVGGMGMEVKPQFIDDSKRFLKPTLTSPSWVRLLMMLAARLPKLDEMAEVGVRAVVASPTSRHIPAAMALSSIAKPTIDRAPVLKPGARVSTILSKSFHDAKVTAVGSRLGLDGTQFDPTVRPLPPAAILPDQVEFFRGERPVPTAAMKLSSYLGLDEVAEWTYQRLCLRPVVVITQRPYLLIEDFADFSTVPGWWNVLQSIALIQPELGTDWWFRRPVLIVSPGAVTNSPWLSQLPISMLVVVGFSAWASPARHFWPRSQHVLMLNQRSDDIADFRDWFDGTDFTGVSVPFGRHLRKSGLTITTFAEPLHTGLAITNEEEDEWEL